MDQAAGRLIVSASDLVGHLACGHLTELDRSVLEGVRAKPERVDEELEVIIQHGFDHERAYLAALRAEGRHVVEIADPAAGDRVASLLEREADTVAAMTAGVDVVFQATFYDEADGLGWRGHADFLTRVDTPSKLGDHSYEPEDTKLARHVKPGAVLQLCQYADHVERIQGVAPENIHVVLGTRERETIRLAEVSAYYRAARARFLAALADRRVVYPLPVSHCSVCRWAEECDERRAADDHLSLVAGLGRHQVPRFEAAQIHTLGQLAAAATDLEVAGIGAPTVARLRQQAQLQLRARTEAVVPVEPLLPLEQGRGLLSLPEPDAGDLFYDIEGDPFVGDVGLEYLHGFGWAEGARFRFHPFWAHSAPEERAAFEALIDFIVERHRQFPGMHVYHYAPYETSALGKLMGRHGTREKELDGLLRADVFVDLYRVVRQGLVIGTPSYGLKKLEPLYMGPRTGEITDGGSSIVEYERWIETGDQAILDAIEAYNRVDVESTWRLRDWLWAHRDAVLQSVAQGDLTVEVSAEQAAEEAMAAAEEAVADPDGIIALSEKLLGGSVTPPDADTDPEVRARFVMAHLLSWHAREDKPEWWRFFDQVKNRDLTDLYNDSDAIARLDLVGDGQADDRSVIWTYRFDPDQEYKIKVGDRPRDPDAERARLLHGTPASLPGEVVALDPLAGTISLRRATSSTAAHPRALIPGTPLPTTHQRRSLIAVARALLAHGIHGEGPYPAARQLLGGAPPRAGDPSRGGPLRRVDESPVAAAQRLVLDLDRSYLAVQGPPGSGKTYAAARAIVALLAQGRKVGVTANSHAVISRVMEEVVDAAAEAGVPVTGVQKSGDGQIVARRAEIEPVAQNAEVLASLAVGANLVGGTPWLFARGDMADAVDTLVVDEAGQLSLANVIAVSPAARNLVLVGDPQQLAQPSKGVHPPGVGLSALEHVLGDAHTIADSRGLFLDRTWRLHPEICAFTSEQVYDGRLESEPHCERQSIAPGPVTSGSGLRWLPVDHTGNRVSSIEEASAVRATFHALMGREHTLAGGTVAQIGIDDVLVVAPYNAQVNQIAELLPPGARVGTVDKFQGQEAAIVIVSMTASDADSVPRGMEFLYSRNRINVAVSRAKAMCVMVASPALLAVSCRSVEQMRLANVLCRYVELATPVAAP